MIDIQNARINSAGAYVCLNGLYPFAMGVKLHNGHIPIIRLGGHREGHETGWQCAAREVDEEARLQIQPLLPPATYLSDWDHMEVELQVMTWEHKIEQEPIPILVVTHCRDDDSHLSIMYLAQAEGVPVPSSEVQGLLLLEEEEIHRLCQESLTLEEYLNNGGMAIMNDKFDTSLVLEPFAQLRLLSKILRVSQNRTATMPFKHDREQLYNRQMHK